MPTSFRRSARPAAGGDIFVDSGGWIALLSRSDAHHRAAVTAWPDVLRQHRRVVVTNLVVGECYTFLRRALGFSSAWAMLERLQATPRVDLVYADRDLEQEAHAILQQYKDQDFSYTDAVSVAAMRRRRIRRAFGFDHHFRTAGFVLIPGVR